MNASRDYRPAAYLFILLGLGLAFVAAMVPFYSSGYRLETTVLVILVLPFAIYGALTESLRGPWLLGPGLLLLGICALAVIRERFLHHGGNANDLIYWVPLLASVVVLPVAYAFGTHNGNN